MFKLKIALVLILAIVITCALPGAISAAPAPPYGDYIGIENIMASLAEDGYDNRENGESTGQPINDEISSGGSVIIFIALAAGGVLLSLVVVFLIVKKKE